MKQKHSVFTRMTILMVILCTSMLVMFYFFFATLRHRNDSVVSANLQQPLSLLIAHQIQRGVKTIESIESELPVQVDKMYDTNLLNMISLDTVKVGSATRVGPQMIFVRMHDDEHYSLYWRSPFEYKNHEILLITLGGGTLIIFVFGYFYIKRLLYPIEKMKEAVNFVAEGKFDVKVPVQTNDEFGQLSSAFNRMSEEIQTMLSAKDQLLSDVSHELKTPITRLRLATEMMDDEKSRDSMEGDLKEMALIVENLLESNRLAYGTDSLKRSDVVLHDLIARIIDKRPASMIQLNGDKDIILDVDGDLITVLFRNLIENAIKYSPENSTIKIDIVSKTGLAQITVRDEGMGIPEEDLVHIFEPFYRVERSRSKKTGGFGLGLSIARKIVDAHQGDISIKNNDGKGVQVTIDLPLA